MSRIGKLPVPIPEKVTITVNSGKVTVEGPKGKLEQTFNPAYVAMTVEDNEFRVAPVGTNRHSRALYGTVRSLVNGMVEGVTKGFVKDLVISGVGFRAAVNGKVLKLELGYSHDINHPIPDGLTVTVADQTKVKVEGYDKQAVGQFAAQVRKFYPVEPYKGKGVRIEGEFVRRKEGKKAG